MLYFLYSSYEQLTESLTVTVTVTVTTVIVTVLSYDPNYYYTENTALLYREETSYSTPDWRAIVSTVIPLSSLQSSILAY